MTALHDDSPITIARDARKAFRSAFPTAKFSLTGQRGTGYGWFSLSWTDGPTRAQVEEVIAPFDARLGQYHSILISRHFSQDARDRAAAEIAAHPGRWFSQDDTPGSNYFETMRCLTELDLT
jgi:hypothetical protein